MDIIIRTQILYPPWPQSHTHTHTHTHESKRVANKQLKQNRIKMSKVYCTKASDIFPIKMGMDPETDGLPPQTFWSAFKEVQDKFGDELAYCACDQTPADGYLTSRSNQEWTFNQTYDDAHRFGRALLATGLKKYQAVNIIGFNSFRMGCAQTWGQ